MQKLLVLLSRTRERIRYIFFIPWIGIIIGTISVLLVVGIMDGMKDKIFTSLEEYNSTYIISNISNSEVLDLHNDLLSHGYSCEVVGSRKVIISNGEKFKVVNLYSKGDQEEQLIIGKGIAGELHLSSGDQVKILSPLDVNLATMYIPTFILPVDSIFSLPVVDFDNQTIFINQSIIDKDALLINKIFIDGELSNKDLAYIERTYPDSNISYYMDEYSELLSAINIEKLLYSFFSYMLIFISCMGLFTINNFIIINKLQAITVLNVLGISKVHLIFSLNMLMIFFSILFSSIGIIFFYNLNYFDLFNPLVSILFPNNIFYDFNIYFNFKVAVIIIILNIISVYLSTIMASRLISNHSSINLMKENI